MLPVFFFPPPVIRRDIFIDNINKLLYKNKRIKEEDESTVYISYRVLSCFRTGLNDPLFLLASLSLPIVSFLFFFVIYYRLVVFAASAHVIFATFFSNKVTCLLFFFFSFLFDSHLLLFWSLVKKTNKRTDRTIIIIKIK